MTHLEDTMITQRRIHALRHGLLRQCGRPDAYLPVVLPAPSPTPATAGATGQLGR
jgi:hypothetical protein